MLKHLLPTPQQPKRVVILGGTGFVGQSLANKLKNDNINTLVLSSKALDLTSESAVEALSQILQPDDSLVILAAITPDKGRDNASFFNNLKMVDTICKSLSKISCQHIVYFSSDAIYPLSNNLVNEDSLAAPEDLYGIMHRSRELMLAQITDIPLCILRPTIIYGAFDTHNSYGPNRFRRQAQQDNKIVMGGEGEETRDHIYINDVVRLLYQVLEHRSQGVLNIASGCSHSFKTVADLVAKQFTGTIEVCPSKRNFPITHRSFDTTQCIKAFPGFIFTPLQEGIKLAHQGESNSNAAV